MADYSQIYYQEGKPHDPFDDEWYRLGFDKQSGFFECQGCFCLTSSWKKHHEVCPKAKVRKKKVTLEELQRGS